MATVLITGAARGIGYELARQYSEAGDRVLATARSPERADRLQALAAASGGQLTVHRMDVADLESVRAAASEIGDLPIDIVINNAGVWGGLDRELLENMDYENWSYEISVMTMGPFRVVQSFLPNVLAGGEKKIIFITSQTSAHAYDHVAGYAYSSAKAGANRIATMLAHDLRNQSVIVAPMHPGWVRTEMAGPAADIEPHESASGIRRVVAAMTIVDSGKFLKWDGGIHPW